MLPLNGGGWVGGNVASGSPWEISVGGGGDQVRFTLCSTAEDSAERVQKRSSEAINEGSSEAYATTHDHKSMSTS